MIVADIERFKQCSNCMAVNLASNDKNIIDQKDERIKELEKENKLLRNNSNCKYGGGNVCTYHNAEYTNCFSACNQWELDNRYKSDFNNIKLKGK